MHTPIWITMLRRAHVELAALHRVLEEGPRLRGGPSWEGGPTGRPAQRSAGLWRPCARDLQRSSDLKQKICLRYRLVLET